VVRTIPNETGQQALLAWQAGAAERNQIAAAVRYTLSRLAASSPGKSVEVRVPPFGAVQVISGPTHTRGTPPNVVETDAQTWLALATGMQTWHTAVATGKVVATGLRSDLSELLPVKL
jgi:hypothetical protein